MKRATLKDIKQLVFDECPVPACPDNGLLLKVAACGVCATDVKIYNYGHHKIKLPRVLGHELAGTIEQVGPLLGDEYKVGQRVAVCAVINCGTCHYCLRGYPSMCESLEAFGYHYDGGYQEYMAVPEKAIRCGGVNVLPDNVSFEDAAVAELLACAINGQNLSDFRFGESLMIIGAGPVGILQAQLAAAKGLNPIFIADIEASKLKTATLLCGSKISGTMDSSDKEKFIRQALEATHNRGFDQVMICCDAAVAQQAALEMVAKCGCINFFGGLPKGKSEVLLDTNHIHYKQCRVVGTHGSSALENRQAIELLSKGQIDLNKVITKRIGLDELESALQLPPADPSNLKTVLVY